MNNKAGDASSDLDIMGANNVIGGPIAGKIYIVSRKRRIRPSLLQQTLIMKQLEDFQPLQMT